MNQVNKVTFFDNFHSHKSLQVISIFFVDFSSLCWLILYPEVKGIFSIFLNSTTMLRKIDRNDLSHSTFQSRNEVHVCWSQSPRLETNSRHAHVAKFVRCRANGPFGFPSGVCLPRQGLQLQGTLFILLCHVQTAQNPESAVSPYSFGTAWLYEIVRPEFLPLHREGMQVRQSTVFSTYDGDASMKFKGQFWSVKTTKLSTITVIKFEKRVKLHMVVLIIFERIVRRLWEGE